MPARIDHVIIAASDLEMLEASFRRLGFTVVGGGTHPHLGTRNRIVILGEGYIELLALADADKASTALRERITRGGGWVGYALQSADIVGEAQAMRTRGIDVRGPVAGRLVAPNGDARSWQVVTVGDADLWAAAFPLPFLIEHASAGAQHQRELAGADEAAPHANGAQSIVGVTVTAPSYTSLRERYQRAYGLTNMMELSTGAVTYPLGHSGEWIRLEQSASAPGQASLASDDIGAMSVELSVTNRVALARILEQAGIGATHLPGKISIPLPGVNAELHVSAPG
jgi:hypothetical protein